MMQILLIMILISINSNSRPDVATNPGAPLPIDDRRFGEKAPRKRDKIGSALMGPLQMLCVFVDRGTFWVPICQNLSQNMSLVLTFFPTLSKTFTFAATPLVRNQKVRWLMDEDDLEPPGWHILLLDKTYEAETFG